MRSSTVLLPVLSAVVPLASANFDIYADTAIDWKRDHLPMAYRILGGEGDADGDCEWVNRKFYPRWERKSDVSGDKYGIRCEGAGCEIDYTGFQIDTMEMNFSQDPLYHWTIYQKDPYPGVSPAPDGGVWMIPSKRSLSPGYCFPYGGDAYNCEHQDMESGGFIVGSRGKRKFRCISDLTADDLNGRAIQRRKDDAASAEQAYPGNPNNPKNYPVPQPGEY